MTKIIYYFGLIQLLLFQVFLFKTKTYYEDETKQNKRIKGRVIIISNHRSFLDGIVVVLRFFFKRFHFLATDFYKDKRKLLKLIVRIAGGIFVAENGQSFDFIEKSKRIIAKERPILIFPEGGFKFSIEPSSFSTGYIMLAIKTGATIVPVVNDFNYGLFKRVNIMIGNSIDLSNYSEEKLTQAKVREINDEIRNKYLMLFNQLKRKKAEKLSNAYDFISPKKGDVIRISGRNYYHYGVYLNTNEVIQFGYLVNQSGEDVLVNSVSMKEFCGTKIPEVRVLKKREKRLKRNTDDIEKYAKSCLGEGGYSLMTNNCLDFANRVILKI